MIDEWGPFKRAGDFSLNETVAGTERVIGTTLLTEIYGHYQSGTLLDKKIGYILLYRRGLLTGAVKEVILETDFYLPGLDPSLSESDLIVAAQGLFKFVQGSMEQQENQSLKIDIEKFRNEEKEKSKNFFNFNYLERLFSSENNK